MKAINTIMCKWDLVRIFGCLCQLSTAASWNGDYCRKALWGWNHQFFNLRWLAPLMFGEFLTTDDNSLCGQKTLTILTFSDSARLRLSPGLINGPSLQILVLLVCEFLKYFLRSSGVFLKASEIQNEGLPAHNDHAQNDSYGCSWAVKFHSQFELRKAAAIVSTGRKRTPGQFAQVILHGLFPVVLPDIWWNLCELFCPYKILSLESTEDMTLFFWRCSFIFFSKKRGHMSRHFGLIKFWNPPNKETSKDDFRPGSPLLCCQNQFWPCMKLDVCCALVSRKLCSSENQLKIHKPESEVNLHLLLPRVAQNTIVLVFGLAFQHDAFLRGIYTFALLLSAQRNREHWAAHCAQAGPPHVLKTIAGWIHLNSLSLDSSAV